MKNLKILLLVSAVFVCTFTTSIFAGWVKDGDLYKYEENGTFKTNDWLAIDGDMYYFDATSHMVTGLQKIGKYYYVFRNNGAAYKKNSTFHINDIEYEVGAKGKVIDLENEFTDEDYQHYLAQKAIEDANNKAFQDAQKAYNESVAAERAIIEKQQAAIKESEKAANAAAQALIDESKKAREDYLLSPENDAKIAAAANRGNASRPVVDNVKKEIKGQLTLRQIELLSKARELRAANPMAELSPFEEDFRDMIKIYSSRVDDILRGLSYKYNVNEDKMSGYVSEFAEFFDEIETSFVTALDNSLG